MAYGACGCGFPHSCTQRGAQAYACEITNVKRAVSPVFMTKEFARNMSEFVRSSSDERGTFITFEGGDGAGKSTHLQLLASGLRARGYEVVCLREPGGTIIGEQLRQAVLDPGNDNMCDECELLIYEAARAQLVSQIIAPALAKGSIVLCDRFFDSTVAYQVAGRGLDADFVSRANDFACQGICPDRTIVMLTGGDAAMGIERATQHKHADRLELAGLEFHERVNRAFLDIAQQHRERVRVVASDESKARTAAKVFAALSDLFAWMGDETVCTPSYFERLVFERDALMRS